MSLQDILGRLMEAREEEPKYFRIDLRQEEIDLILSNFPEDKRDEIAERLVYNRNYRLPFSFIESVAQKHIDAGRIIDGANMLYLKHTSFDHLREDEEFHRRVFKLFREGLKSSEKPDKKVYGKLSILASELEKPMISLIYGAQSGDDNFIHFLKVEENSKSDLIKILNILNKRKYDYLFGELAKKMGEWERLRDFCYDRSVNGSSNAFYQEDGLEEAVKLTLEHNLDAEGFYDRVTERDDEFLKSVGEVYDEHTKEHPEFGSFESGVRQFNIDCRKIDLIERKRRRAEKLHLEEKVLECNKEIAQIVLENPDIMDYIQLRKELGLKISNCLPCKQTDEDRELSQEVQKLDIWNVGVDFHSVYKAFDGAKMFEEGAKLFEGIYTAYYLTSFLRELGRFEELAELHVKKGEYSYAVDSFRKAGLEEQAVLYTLVSEKAIDYGENAKVWDDFRKKMGDVLDSFRD